MSEGRIIGLWMALILGIDMLGIVWVVVTR